eukprot:CAMPEP_0117503722 /NCGR_PEP_ID=MMETSP0784-20121206/24478_1 /TAXON_ID=39447 /ORGANISM="" /LENGTH=273 /DNA_ID=CAMNT_0005299051 /DNA_START=26 /DNA_END=847 /DNA_ORIENTATION=+
MSKSHGGRLLILSLLVLPAEVFRLEEAAMASSALQKNADRTRELVVGPANHTLKADKAGDSSHESGGVAHKDGKGFNENDGLAMMDPAASANVSLLAQNAPGYDPKCTNVEVRIGELVPPNPDHEKGVKSWWRRRRRRTDWRPEHCHTANDIGIKVFSGTKQIELDRGINRARTFVSAEFSSISGDPVTRVEIDINGNDAAFVDYVEVVFVPWDGNCIYDKPPILRYGEKGDDKFYCLSEDPNDATELSIKCVSNWPLYVKEGKLVDVEGASK